MSDDTTAAAEREEIEMLLPWYVSGRLDADDRARVERHLARDASLRLQLDLIGAERQEAIAANEALRDAIGRRARPPDGVAAAAAAEPGRAPWVEHA